MNSNSPVATGAAAISGGAIGSILQWLCTVGHIPVPPDYVASSIGAIVLVIAHLVINKWFLKEPKQ